MSDLIYRQIGRDAHYKVWHKSKNNMFILIQAGTGCIVSTEKSYPMKKGTLCFIGCNKHHYTFPDIPDQYIRSKLFISSEELEKISPILSPYRELCNMIDENQISIGLLNEKNFRYAEDIFAELNRLKGDSAYFKTKAYAAILDMTILLSQSINEDIQPKFGNIQTAVEYINQHITEDISIDKICSACYLSKYHFCRLFKKKIGLTVMEYVLKTRIAIAKELLFDGAMSVTEVSEACAFSSISYFSRVFKSETGMTPLQYKKAKNAKKSAIHD